MTLTRSLSRLALALAGGVLVSAMATAQPAPPPPPMGHGPGADGGAGPMHGQPGPAGRAAHAGMGAGPMGAPGAMLHEHQLDAVGASAEQKARIRAIFKAAHDEVATLHEAQRALHQQMAQLLSAPQLDATAAEALRQKMSAGHDQISKRLLQAALDAGAVLSPAQRQQMAERMAKRREMMERHFKERRELDGAPLPRG